jgi:hypothetical protein
MKTNLRGTAGLVAVLAMFAPLAHAQKIFGPADISNLANTSESNSGYYNANIIGATVFSGQGVVFENRHPRVTSSDGSYNEGHIGVDVGTGSVGCEASKLGDFADIRRGDVVRISGRTGGASTWRKLGPQLAAIGPIPGVPWRVGHEYIPKDMLQLLTDTCHVEKVN